ncbi:MAG TPA: hypothetical protein VK211_15810 [Kamptonema sp.]|nr:hypothetical protein [Kamptonema sp.]
MTYFTSTSFSQNGSQMDLFTAVKPARFDSTLTQLSATLQRSGIPYVTSTESMGGTVTSSGRFFLDLVTQSKLHSEVEL